MCSALLRLCLALGRGRADGARAYASKLRLLVLLPCSGQADGASPTLQGCASRAPRAGVSGAHPRASAPSAHALIAHCTQPLRGPLPVVLRTAGGWVYPRRSSASADALDAVSPSCSVSASSLGGSVGCAEPPRMHHASVDRRRMDCAVPPRLPQRKRGWRSSHGCHVVLGVFNVVAGCRPDCLACSCFGRLCSPADCSSACGVLFDIGGKLRSLPAVAEPNGAVFEALEQDKSSEVYFHVDAPSAAAGPP